MVERICQACQYGNTLEAHYCSKCGAALERQMLARRPSSALALFGRALPVSWRQLGTTVALGAAALAAEAGLAWVRQRIEGAGDASSAAPLARRAAGKALLKPDSPASSVVTIISQRVVEILDSGDGRRQVVDRHVWRKIEE